MKREEVRIKLKAVQAELKKLEKQENPKYHSEGIYIPGIGEIHEVNSLQQLIKAHAIITKAKVDLTNSSKELEIELEDEEFEYNGIEISKWMEDIKARKNQIAKEKRMSALYGAEKILEKNLSDDDKFDIDMESISDILGSV